MTRGRPAIPEKKRSKIIRCIFKKQLKATETARLCRCSVSTVYKYASQYRKENLGN